MSWGYKILLLYLGFVTIILTLVFNAFNFEVEIVATDYYEREMYQQDIINGNFNLLKLGDRPTIERESGGLTITLPNVLEGSKKEGELWLYHIMRKDMDYQITFEDHSDNYFKIREEELAVGNYILKLRWTQDETPYYMEERVNIR